ncbi:MAG: hypothetical protein HYY58_03030 [Candidatus Omnitrophica bacterium]|nr:hypothetical protein [Candidatus Omnitrophota bacterium]
MSIGKITQIGDFKVSEVEPPAVTERMPVPLRFFCLEPISFLRERRREHSDLIAAMAWELNPAGNHIMLDCLWDEGEEYRDLERRFKAWGTLYTVNRVSLSPHMVPPAVQYVCAVTKDLGHLAEAIWVAHCSLFDMGFYVRLGVPGDCAIQVELRALPETTQRIVNKRQRFPELQVDAQLGCELALRSSSVFFRGYDRSYVDLISRDLTFESLERVMRKLLTKSS